jgi:hypothetical protein
MNLKHSQTIRSKSRQKPINVIEQWQKLNRKTNRISYLQSKRRKKLQSSVKNMYYSNNPEEIKTEIENLGHTVLKVWNIKQ